MRTSTETKASLYGTEGSIEIPAPCFKPDGLIVRSAGGEAETISLPPQGHGFTYEIRGVMRCLREGETESPALTHDMSLGIMRTLDRIREAW